MEATERKYQNNQEYIFEAHPDLRWVFTVADMAKKWPGHTEELGKAAQEDIIQTAVKYARERDARKGIHVRISG